MPSSFRKYLLSPISPSNGAAFLDSGFSVAELRKNHGSFSLATSAVTQLPADILVPSFDGENIRDPKALTDIIVQTVEVAGLKGRKRWSIGLPEGVARTLVIGIEGKPSTRRELAEILGWKVERAIAVQPSELQISQQRIRPVSGEERYIVSVVHTGVLAEYEALFKRLGWTAGLIVPRHLGEVQWLFWDSSPEDKLLVSANPTGFTAIVVQGGEPAIVRSQTCEPESRMDELFRIARYYRDRIAQNQSHFGRALVLGDLDPGEARQVIKDATGQEPSLIDPAEFGFDLSNEPVRFDQLAAAAGLATLAWQ